VYSAHQTRYNAYIAKNVKEEQTLWVRQEECTEDEKDRLIIYAMIEAGKGGQEQVSVMKERLEYMTAEEKVELVFEKRERGGLE
jgi:hypothetical protein